MNRPGAGTTSGVRPATTNGVTPIGSTDRTTAIGRTEMAPDEGWDRIPIDLSGGSDDRETDEDDAFEGDEYGPEASSTPIEGGDPDLENALFVLLGAVAMMLVIVRLVLIIV